MYFSESEEWFAIFICFIIVISFIASTIQNIRETISEEKQKHNIIIKLITENILQ